MHLYTTFSVYVSYRLTVIVLTSSTKSVWASRFCVADETFLQTASSYLCMSSRAVYWQQREFRVVQVAQAAQSLVVVSLILLLVGFVKLVWIHKHSTISCFANIRVSDSLETKWTCIFEVQMCQFSKSYMSLKIPYSHRKENIHFFCKNPVLNANDIVMPQNWCSLSEIIKV